MIASLHDRSRRFSPVTLLIAAAALSLAFLLGQRASLLWLGLLVAALGGLVLLARPAWGLFALVLAALVVPLEFGTGTEVSLNPVTLLIPAVAAVWLLGRIRQSRLEVAASPVNRPLLLFLLAGLFSLLIGRATWDPLIPVGGNFLFVQLAQWAIFALSALAFWLTANLIRTEKQLWQLTALFLLVGGGVAIARLLPGLGGMVGGVTTIAFVRAPFWALLTGLAGGQLLWNDRLTLAWKLFLAGLIATSLYVGIFVNRESSSTWVGIVAVLAVLIWLRQPRWRPVIIFLITTLVILDILFPFVWEFAGGDEDWGSTGEGRLVLIERVIDVTMHNPWTGLGPAAYRLYAGATPLFFPRGNWIAPRISSHNNYVDLFSHGGVVGLLLFGWCLVALARVGLRLRQSCPHGFAAGYVNGMLATGVSALVLMMFADWILPFVYNIGFPGFQASVLVWLFLGGLLALENMDGGTIGKEGNKRNGANGRETGNAVGGAGV